MNVAATGELDPTVGMQFDLALEWYFADYSIASVRPLHEGIEGFVQNDIELVPFAGVIDPDTNQPLVLEAFRPLNTGRVRIWLAWSCRSRARLKDMLPAPFDSLGLIANYTYINSGIGLQERENQWPHTAFRDCPRTRSTSPLFYEKGPWSGQDIL